MTEVSVHRNITALLLGFAVLVGVGLSRAGAGEQLFVNVSGHTLKLLVPDGFCLLDEQLPADSRLVSFIRRVIAGTNELLLIAADCTELQEIHDGKRDRLGSFVQVQVPTQFKSVDVTGQEAQVASTICTQMRTTIADQMPALGADVKSRVESLSNGGIKVNETQLLGVLADEPGVCYTGLVQHFEVAKSNGAKSSAADKTKGIAITGVFATFGLKGRLVFLYHFAPGIDISVVDQLLEAAKADVAAQLAANR